MSRFTEKEKTKFVQGYIKSGLSCIEYCRQNNIHPNTLYRWKNQYEEKQNERGTFIEIAAPTTTADDKQTSCIDIHTNDFHIQIPANIGNEQIAFLFKLMGLTHVC